VKDGQKRVDFSKDGPEVDLARGVTGNTQGAAPPI
jgi:hypothetical protein